MQRDSVIFRDLQGASIIVSPLLICVDELFNGKRLELPNVKKVVKNLNSTAANKKVRWILLYSFYNI
ncbi:MAG: hypothetical protein NTW85_00945 [Methylococcales bacterium]|nr:hypothetical protein [Methylococcales bacterium]